MRLSARILENVANINNWDIADEATLQDGEINTFHIQLLNHSKEDIRYITEAAIYSVKVCFLSIDDAQEIEVSASQPFTDDKSIWKVSLTASQTPKSGAFIIKLTENGVERKIKVEQSLIVELLEDGGC